MIFVTLGTQKQPFTRLLSYLEDLDLKEEIVVQNGNTSYSSSHMKLLGFLSYQEMEEYVKKANLIISHGGGGTIFLALRHQKSVICVPRLRKYKEHINDHQVELIDTLVQKGYVVACQTKEELEERLANRENWNLQLYQPDRENFVTQMRQEIDSLLQEDSDKEQ